MEASRHYIGKNKMLCLLITYLPQVRIKQNTKPINNFIFQKQNITNIQDMIYPVPNLSQISVVTAYTTSFSAFKNFQEFFWASVSLARPQLLYRTRRRIPHVVWVVSIDTYLFPRRDYFFPHRQVSLQNRTKGNILVYVRPLY